MSTGQLFFERLRYVGFEVVVQLRLRKLICDAQHLIYHIVRRRNSVAVDLLIPAHIFDMVPQHRRICLDHVQIIQRRFYQLVNIILRKLKSIQKLVMDLHHAAIKEMRRLLMLHDTKVTVFVQQSQPLFQSSKLHVLNTTGRSNDLDIADILRQRETGKLGYVSNATIGKELLDIGIKTGRFEKPVPQKDHTVILPFAHSTFVNEGLSVPNTVLDLNLFRL